MLWGVLASLLVLRGVGFSQALNVPDLKGVIDLHAHVAPESGALNFRRSLDAIETAQIAKIYGMRGIVFKEHHTETASWAYLVSQMVPGIELFGGIVLNRWVGGMNPSAVEAMAMTRGGRGKIVYMPTTDAEGGKPGRPGSVPVVRNGKLLPEVLEVLKVTAKHNLGLSTGHLTPDETILLIKAAKAAGVNKIYVQHPNHSGMAVSMTQMKEMVKLGALIEVVLSGEGLTGGPPGGKGPVTVNKENPVIDYGPQKIADIRELGPQNIVLTSDLGQPGRVTHADSFRIALQVLAKEGFSQADIDVMTKRNPARFLGLE
jgi:hypothetical protein